MSGRSPIHPPKPSTSGSRMATGGSRFGLKIAACRTRCAAAPAWSDVNGDRRTKLARNLVTGDLVRLKPQSTLGWGLQETVDSFTVSKVECYSSGRGSRVLVYTQERGGRPVAWLRGSTRVEIATSHQINCQNTQPTKSGEIHDARIRINC